MLVAALAPSVPIDLAVGVDASNTAAGATGSAFGTLGTEAEPSVPVGSSSGA